MHYKPHELKLVPLKDLPPGTIARIVGRDDIPFVWRLVDTDENANRILVLGGEYSFHAVDWSIEDELARIVCEADQVRFNLAEPSTNSDPRAEGALVVREGGAYINAMRKRDEGFRRPKIDIATSSEEELGGRMDDFLVFDEWELGKVNHKDEFKLIFQNKKS